MVTQVETEVQQLWQNYQQERSTELRNRLVERYLPLVKYNAERIWSRLPEGVELDDLISAGVFGLMDAIDAFDLERGVKFETYCVPRIRGAMLDELRTMDWVPRLVRSKASKLEVARKSIEAEEGRPPRPGRPPFPAAGQALWQAQELRAEKGEILPPPPRPRRPPRETPVLPLGPPSPPGKLPGLPRPGRPAKSQESRRC